LRESHKIEQHRKTCTVDTLKTAAVDADALACAKATL
jgi:hypothetical protein